MTAQEKIMGSGAEKQWLLPELIVSGVLCVCSFRLTAKNAEDRRKKGFRYRGSGNGRAR